MKSLSPTWALNSLKAFNPPYISSFEVRGREKEGELTFPELYEAVCWPLYARLIESLYKFWEVRITISTLQVKHMGLQEVKEFIQL